jgi:O-acetyl-ADP-ribose deacetylase (regulator of RNase III)
MKIVLADRNPYLIDAWKASGGHSAVETFEGSIFDAGCEAIVSPANSFGLMSGGLDEAITNRFGWKIQQDLQMQILRQPHEELLVGQAAIVFTGKLDIMAVVCAPTMRVPMILPPGTVNVFLSARAALQVAKQYGIQSIAVPGMGTGVGRVAPELFARQFLAAVNFVTSPVRSLPGTWRDAMRQHQELYTDEIRNLQQ